MRTYNRRGRKKRKKVGLKQQAKQDAMIDALSRGPKKK